MSISTENFLAGIPAFSQGAFSTANNGLKGNGWGINTSTYFTSKNTKEFTEFNLTPTGGLYIDLYSLFEMYPIEKLTFEADFGEFTAVNNSILPKQYFTTTLTENVLNVIPNTSKLKEDNFPTKSFLVQITYRGENKEDIIVLKFNYLNTNIIEYSPIEKTITYDTLNLTIGLNSLIKESFGDITSKFEIKTLNSKPLSDYGLVKDDVIFNNTLVMDKIPVIDPILVLTYKDDLYSINYEFKLTFKFREQKPSPTMIPDIYITISSKDAALIDVKQFVTGETYKLECEEFGIWNNSKANDYFKCEITKSFITVIPYSFDIIDEVNGLKDTTEYIKKIRYSTPNTGGLFNLHVIIDVKNSPRNKEDYKFLVPMVKTKTLKLSDKELVASVKPLNLLGLIQNHYFPSKDNTNLYGQIKGEFIAPIISGLELNHLNGVNLYNTSSLVVPNTIKVKFNFPNSIFQVCNIGLEEDTPLFKEFFDVSPMIFNVSKNKSNIINIIDHVFTDNENYKYLEIDTLSFNKTHLNLPDMYNFAVVKTIYNHNIDFDETLTGIIKVKLKNKYTNDTNRDDFGNIIGYREIPYTIIKDTSKNNIETSLDLDITDLKFYASTETSNIIERFNAGGEALAGIDGLEFENGDITILNVSINPFTTLSTSIVPFNVAPPIDKVSIIWEPNRYWELFYNGTNPEQITLNSKIVLDIEYKNSKNEVKKYIQNLYFYLL